MIPIDYTKHNLCYVFEEHDEKDLTWIFDGGKNNKYVTYPIEGPAFLKMLLSKRQLKQLKDALANKEIPEDDTKITEIRLEGRTRKSDETLYTVGAILKKDCDCDITVLIAKGCQCGAPK